jgi:molybdenum cofactor synthesis domain-containing protein
MMTAAVLTTSDRCAAGERQDHSGPAVAELLRQNGYEVHQQRVVPDDQSEIEQAIISLSQVAQLVVSTGGTGIASRDVTPEATRAVCSRLVEGLAEKMRLEGARVTPHAFLSRAICGVCGDALVVNLPGSPEAASQSLLAILDVLPHALDLLGGKTEHGNG